VLSLSTVHTVHNITDLIERERRRPNKTSTNAAITRKAFGNEARKKLFIPTFIDDYNYHMGGVDLANQYRAEYKTHKPVFRSWFCLFTALLDIVIVNCYRLSYEAAKSRSVPITKLPEQAKFRERLFRQLFAYALHPTIQLAHRH
jgi:Transposase IS4